MELYRKLKARISLIENRLEALEKTPAKSVGQRVKSIETKEV